MIEIKCRGADILPLDAIEDFQGNLKKLSPSDIDKIIKSIEVYGFSFPFFVWNVDGHNRCLDGHGRIQALCKMRQNGVDLPMFPVVYIDAKDEDEAKQKLLGYNLAIVGPNFEPVGIDEQGKLDEKQKHICPECGCEF